MGWVLMSEREVHRVEVLSSVVARRLGRHRSSVFRELRRNPYHDAKISDAELLLGRSRSTFCSCRFRHRKVVRHPELRCRITRCLQAGWSPEQIAGRLRLEAAPLRVSHETIYQFVYSDESHAAELWRHLATVRRNELLPGPWTDFRVI